ncbi:TMV resistance protein N, partial [Mucuna pruriens]
MASSSETSPQSSMLQISDLEKDFQALMDQRKRKRKRMLSNHESARRSRIRRKTRLDNLVAAVTQLRKENSQILTLVTDTTRKYLEVETENLVLKAQMSELSSSISEKRTYRVFLSFEGEDTSAPFVSHLYASLQNAGIIVFEDEKSLPRGHHISQSQLQAIEQSQISVVVFSRNYAESRWCLQELEKIMECRRTIGQVVVPVFYGVDPSEVRHQTGEFGKAFKNLSNGIVTGEDEKLQPWREALGEVAGISGVVVLNSSQNCTIFNLLLTD